MMRPRTVFLMSMSNNKGKIKSQEHNSVTVSTAGKVENKNDVERKRTQAAEALGKRGTAWGETRELFGHNHGRDARTHPVSEEMVCLMKKKSRVVWSKCVYALLANLVGSMLGKVLGT